MGSVRRLVVIAMACGIAATGCAPAAVPAAQPTATPVTVESPRPQSAAPAAAAPTPVSAAKPPPALPTPAPAGALERQLIDMMVPHHQGALEMARIAEERAERLEIKAMAAEMLRTQAAEIEQMKALRLAWFNSDATPPMSEMPMLDGMRLRASHTGHTPGTQMTMDMAADVEALRTAPEPFDVAFIDAMIPHHQDAVDAAQIVLRREVRPELRTLVSAIAEVQTREIAQMQRWRAAWVSGTDRTQPGAPAPGLKDEHAEGH